MDPKITVQEIEWTDQKVQKLWDYYATFSDAESYYSRHSGGHILRYLSRWLDFTSCDILDYGCGPGYLMEHLVRKSRGRVFGLDFSTDSVAKANARLAGHPHFAGALQTASIPSPFQSGSMDLVIAVEVIEHLSNDKLQAMLSEINRLLKVGGHLVLTTPHEEKLEDLTSFCPNCEVKFHRWQHVRSWSVKTLTEVLVQNGFKPRVVRPRNFHSTPARIISGMRGMAKRVLRKEVEPEDLHLFAVAEKGG